MKRRKDYAMSAVDAFTAEISSTEAACSVIPPVRLQGNRFDFNRWCFAGGSVANADTGDVAGIDAGRLEIVSAMRDAVSRMSKTLSPRTILSICRGSIPNWFSFLDEQRLQGRHVSKMADVSKDLLDAYVFWLRHKPAETETGVLSYVAARAIYSHTKSVLLECVSTGILNRDCLPVNPFPGSNRSSKGHQPFSPDEMNRLVVALAADLGSIRSGNFEGSEADTLVVYLLLIAARTGRNPAPLLELRRDALQPHPLKPASHALLTTYKRRGNNIAVQSFRNTREVEDISTVHTDVVSLFNEVLALTAHHLESVSESNKSLLWLCRRQPNGGWGHKIAPFDVTLLSEAVARFVDRHGLLSDEDHPLRVTIMRLRKTFATRVWRLTGGDLLRTSNALGNLPSMTDSHYLVVTPEMERNHKFVGLCLETRLRGEEGDLKSIQRLAAEMRVSTDEVQRVLAGEHNTGVGRCSSPFYGKFAPQTGQRACTAFLHCFRCPNQVVMESDLHRLFSFYWLLIKERNLLGRNRWHKVYGWVIREIDHVISARFPVEVVRVAKEEAAHKPHPMWRERAILGGVAHG